MGQFDVTGNLEVALLPQLVFKLWSAAGLYVGPRLYVGGELGLADPSVSITAPSQGQSFLSSQSIPLNASVDGGIRLSLYTGLDLKAGVEGLDVGSDACIPTSNLNQNFSVRSSENNQDPCIPEPCEKEIGLSNIIQRVKQGTGYPGNPSDMNNCFRTLGEHNARVTNDGWNIHPILTTDGAYGWSGNSGEVFVIGLDGFMYRDGRYPGNVIDLITKKVSYTPLYRFRQ